MLEPIDALISWQAVSRPPLLPTVAGARAIDRRTENEKPLSRKQVMVYIYNIYPVPIDPLLSAALLTARPVAAQRSAAHCPSAKLAQSPHARACAVEGRREEGPPSKACTAPTRRRRPVGVRRPIGLDTCGRAIRAAVAPSIAAVIAVIAAMSDRSIGCPAAKARRSHLSECTRCHASHAQYRV
jgi:hypothetical protein